MKPYLAVLPVAVWVWGVNSFNVFLVALLGALCDPRSTNDQAACELESLSEASLVPAEKLARL